MLFDLSVEFVVQNTFCIMGDRLGPCLFVSEMSCHLSS